MLVRQHFLSGLRVLVERGGHDEVLLVGSIAEWRLVGVFASTQPDRGVLLLDEAQRQKTAALGFVRSVAEGLGGRPEQIRGQMGFEPSELPDALPASC